MSEPRHWRVTVEADGKQILCIESNCLSGIPNIQDYAITVRNCARHLLAFIGDRDYTALQQEVETLRERLNREENAHAELQARCFDNGFPTGSSIFDAYREALAALEGEETKPSTNWERLISKYENFVGKQYRDIRNGKIYTFFGLVHSDDDYYYGMCRVGELQLHSCVFSIETGGLELLAAPEGKERRSHEIEAYIAAGPQSGKKEDGWISVKSAMPKTGTPVIAFVENVYGNKNATRRIRAEYAAPKSLPLHEDAEGGEYDETTDQYYCEEGWYESNEFEETHWRVDGDVTNWMPLPSPPSNEL